MIQHERYGIRPDGNVVVETSSYVPVPADHPLATTLEGVEGHWVRTMVGNSFVGMGAEEVTHARYLQAKDEIEQRQAAFQMELAQKREERREELEGKMGAVRRELAQLGLSADTINAILDQVRG